MAGTKEGARKSRQTIKEKYGDDFYAFIGYKGGSNSKTGGFAARPELAKRAGELGGRSSTRRKKAESEKLKQEREKRRQYLEEGLKELERRSENTKTAKKTQKKSNKSSKQGGDYADIPRRA